VSSVPTGGAFLSYYGNIREDLPMGFMAHIGKPSKKGGKKQ
jgi:hypothetical protein